MRSESNDETNLSIQQKETAPAPLSEATKASSILIPPPQISRDSKNEEDRIRNILTRLLLALHAGNIGVWEWDFKSNNLVWDAEMYAIYGVPEGMPVTSDLWKKAVHPDDLSQAGGVFSPTVQYGLREKHKFRILHPAKGIRFIEAAEELVMDGHGTAVACVGIHQDLTEWWQTREALLASQNELEKQSLTDHLTGVGNRRSLDQKLAHEISRVRRYGGKLSFLIADLDDFKSINDEFGHEAGDTALRTAAEIMASMVRDTDVLTRFGGDEFCIVMPGTGCPAAGGLADRIRWRLGQSAIEGTRRHLTASFGIVQLRDDDTVESLFERADQALYQAKAFGKNRSRSNFGDAVRAALDELPKGEETGE